MENYGDSIRELIKKYREIIVYVIVGGATTLVDWGVYAILTAIHVNVNISNTLAWAAAVIFAFFTNKLFVFESKSFEPVLAAKEAVMFFGTRAFSGALEIIGLPLLLWLGLNQSLLGIDGFLAKVLLSVIVMILNYIFSKLWIFKKKG